jgi:hypothetical protein
MSRFERRVARIERLQGAVPEPPPDLRMFVMVTLVGFYRCDRRDDEHPLVAYGNFLAAAAGGPDDCDPWRGLFAAHGVNIETEPTPDAIAAMQRLLDGVPEHWRDANVAWWPTSAIDMWTEPEPQTILSDCRRAARIERRRLGFGDEAAKALRQQRA